MERRRFLGALLGVGAGLLVGPSAFSAWYAPVDYSARIQAAIDEAIRAMPSTIYVPAGMLPYDASLVTFSSSVRMIR